MPFYRSGIEKDKDFTRETDEDVSPVKSQTLLDFHWFVVCSLLCKNDLNIVCQSISSNQTNETIFWKKWFMKNMKTRI